MKLTSQWVAGFVDGEGCFHIGYYKNGQIQPEFVVVQHTRSIKVLYAMKSFFGCGSIRRQKPLEFKPGYRLTKTWIGQREI